MGRAGRRRRTIRAPALVVALLLAVALPACSDQSHVDPSADVHITGTALDAGGAPLANRPVHLDAGVSDSEVVLAIFTFGLSCVTGGCHGKQVDTTTDAAGSFSFTVKGSDTRSTFGEALNQVVSTSAAPAAGQVSGASVSASFKVQSTNVALPALKLVDPALHLDTTAPPHVRASWSTPASGPYDLTYEDGTAAAVWRVSTQAPAAEVDARVLEDKEGRVVVAGGSTDQIEGSEVDIHWRSPGLGFAGPGAPPSRSGQCSAVTASGTSTPSGCGLTDGDLTTPATLPTTCATSSTNSSACPPLIAVDVDLRAPIPAELVVIRGCPGQCDVAVSSDGTTFSSVGAATYDDTAIGLNGTPVTAVRVTLASGSPALREVSVWGAAPTGHDVAQTDADELRSPFDGNDDPEVPTTLAVGAAGLIGLTMVGIGFFLGRRRHT